MQYHQTSEEFGAYRPSLGLRALLAIARNSFLGRGNARHILLRFLRKTHGDIIDMEIWGARARLYLTNTNETRAAIQPRRYNAAELAFLAKHLDKPNATFFDIGANAGLYTLNLAARATHSATYIAIEPNPDMAACAAFYLKHLNPQFKAKGIDIRIVETALGSEAGVAELLVSGRGMGAAQITKSGGDHKVAMQTLLHVAEQQHVAAIDALKIDVEGYEDQVLMPFLSDAPKTLFPRAIVIEHASADEWTDNVLARLLDVGYQQEARSRGNTMLTLNANT